jgi:predicted permease
MSYPAFTDFRDGSTTLSEVAAIDDIDLSYGVGTDARSLRAVAASGQYFPLIRATPALGVFFGESHDALPSGERVAVISHGLWRTAFGERPDVLGAPMLLNGATHVVIGVAPRGFTGTSLRPVDVWVPLSTQLDSVQRTSRGWQFVEIFARLKDGVTREAANADVERAYHVGHADQHEYEAKAVASLGHLIPARDAEGRGGASQVATWLFGMAVVVLLIACANVANLMLARGITRRGEFAVRRALGVSSTRLARALLTESVVLTVLASVVALVIARWGGAFARRTLLPGVSWEGSAINGRVLALTLACTIFAAIIAGLLPLWSASRTDIGQALRGSARGLTARARRTLGVLLVVQTTLATATLIGAGLFVASLDRVKNLDLGFNPAELLRARVRLAADVPVAEQSAIHQRAIERLSTTPGVVRAGGVRGAPFMGNYAASVRVPGRDSIPRQPGGGPYFFRLTPGAFEALGFRVTRGRAFTDADARAGGPPTATIITERFAQAAWPAGNAIGNCLILDDDAPCTPVVGVIADLHRQGIREDPFFAFFIPIAAGDTANVPDALVVRVHGDAERAVELVRREFHAVAPGLPFVAVEPYEELINPQARSWRLGATMFTTFGLLSLLIAAVGVHGMLSYLVSARTRELGVRAALGATPASMLRMVMAGGFTLALIGVVVGSAIALAAGTRIESLLFDTSARDPMVFAAAAAVIVAVTLIATLLPGVRAARADPLRALRAE